MSTTAQDRGYGWGLQTDYVTEKANANGAYKRLNATDDNTIDYEVQTGNDKGWSHGANQATEQWVESHDDNVSHTIPGQAQELGKIFLINLGDYAISTPSGGTVSKDHLFKPQNPAVSRQNRAVTYVETVGSGYNVSMPRSVGNGFTLKGDDKGVLLCDFGLQGAGQFLINAPTTWTGATPSVSKLTGLHKFFNTQMTLVATDGVTPVTYGCRYRSFEVAYKMSLLLEAGYKQGCADFRVSGDPTSGIIRSACEFNEQMLDFKFIVDMASNSPELIAVQQQKKMNIVLTATGGIIEGAIRHKMIVTIPVAYYSMSKPTIKNDIWTFEFSGAAFFDYVSEQLFNILLTTNVADFALAF